VGIAAKRKGEGPRALETAAREKIFLFESAVTH
jgi:hypothetical protein